MWISKVEVFSIAKWKVAISAILQTQPRIISWIAAVNEITTTVHQGLLTVKTWTYCWLNFSQIITTQRDTKTWLARTSSRKRLRAMITVSHHREGLIKEAKIATDRSTVQIWTWLIWKCECSTLVPMVMPSSKRTFSPWAAPLITHKKAMVAMRLKDTSAKGVRVWSTLPRLGALWKLPICLLSIATHWRIIKIIIVTALWTRALSQLVPSIFQSRKASKARLGWQLSSTQQPSREGFTMTKPSWVTNKE